jgi:hypothetical protein
MPSSPLSFFDCSCSNLVHAWRLKTREFFHYRHGAEMLWNEKALLDQMSDTLRTEALLYIHAGLVQAVPWLCDYRGAFPSFVCAVLRRLECAQCGPGDMVVCLGDEGEHMYFIERGEVEVLAMPAALRPPPCPLPFFPGPLRPPRPLRPLPSPPSPSALPSLRPPSARPPLRAALAHGRPASGAPARARTHSHTLAHTRSPRQLRLAAQWAARSYSTGRGKRRTRVQ